MREVIVEPDRVDVFFTLLEKERERLSGLLTQQGDNVIDEINKIDLLLEKPSFCELHQYIGAKITTLEQAVAIAIMSNNANDEKRLNQESEIWKNAFARLIAGPNNN